MSYDRINPHVRKGRDDLTGSRGSNHRNSTLTEDQVRTWVNTHRARASRRRELLAGVRQSEQAIPLGPVVSSEMDRKLKEQWATPRHEYVPEPVYIWREQ